MFKEADEKANLLTIIVSNFGSEQKTKRVDHYLSGLEGFPSRSQLKQWFEKACIQRGSKILSPSDLVSPGDELKIVVPPAAEAKLEARNIPLEISYEDEELVVVFKPRGLSMHPGTSYDTQDTLVHALLHHGKLLSEGSSKFRPGIVHRLDKDTEGLVVVAKNNETHEGLARQFAERKIRRAYWALVSGRTPEVLEIEAPIGRHPTQRKKMAVHTRGKPARTSVRRLGEFSGPYSWVECRLHTGRTHQIRVHLAHKGHPLLNDPLYSRPKVLKLSAEKQKALDELKGQALVAFELGFFHPKLKKDLLFRVEPPVWLRALTAKD